MGDVTAVFGAFCLIALDSQYDSRFDDSFDSRLTGMALRTLHLVPLDKFTSGF